MRKLGDPSVVFDDSERRVEPPVRAFVGWYGSASDARRGNRTI